MIEYVSAEQFNGLAAGGNTEPIKFGCRTSDGEIANYFTKSTWGKCPVESLVREAVSYQLATDLGLRVAAGACVLIPAELVDIASGVDRVIGERLRSAVVPSFGSRNVGDGFRWCIEVPPGIPHEEVAEIWAFDRLTLNPDRRRGRPNCLANDKYIALIDHELALEVTGIGGLVPYPWSDGSIKKSETLQPHLFWDFIKGSGASLERMAESWEKVSEDAIRSYVDCLPDTWKASSVTDEIIQYLLILKANIRIAFKQLRGALI